jgi:formylglycine-generating enzyme required for sulfatase activity
MLNLLRNQVVKRTEQTSAALSELVYLCTRLRAECSAVTEDVVRRVLERVGIEIIATSGVPSRVHAISNMRSSSENQSLRTWPSHMSGQSAASVSEATSFPVFHKPNSLDEFQELPGLPKESWPRMRILPGGWYVLGSPKNEENSYRNERPQQQIILDYELAVGAGPVTVDQFSAFIRDSRWDMGTRARIFSESTWRYSIGAGWNNPGFPQTGSHPVTCISWFDTQAYLSWLNRKLGLEAQSSAYRLLSESEWEYACRAGCDTTYSFGDKITPDLANFRGDLNSKKGTSPVGKYPSNAFGLYDMHGNVWEWCQDLWKESYEGIPSNGSPRLEFTGDPRRVARGGSFNSEAAALRSARRGRCYPEERDFDQGFRIARTLVT